MKKIFLTILCCYVLVANAQNNFYSFETTVPTEWNNVTNGTVAISGSHYKNGIKSLQWNWNQGSTITVNNTSILNLTNNSKNAGSAIWAWVYNESAKSSTDSAYFNFTNSSGNVLAKFGFCLNFTGWRFMWVCFNRDLKYRYSAGNELTTMRITAPSTGSGTLFFDMVETIETSGINWHRSSDLQYTVAERDASHRNISYNQIADQTGLNLNDTIQANTIKNRLMQWFVGNAAYAGNRIYNSRRTGLLGRVNMYKNSSWTINKTTKFVRQNSNSVLAYVKDINGIDSGIGLHGDLIGYQRKFVDISTGCIFWLAMDVALNNASNASDLQRCIDIMDWMYDQGYAEGSGLGTGSTQLFSSGFPFAFFLLHSYITDTSKYNKYMRSIRWLVKDTYSNSYSGASADAIRGSAIAKLTYALCLKDPTERLAELRDFQNYMNNAVAIAPKYFGLVKPDYSVYHHEMPYYSEYGDDAIHQSALAMYLLRGTNFNLSNTSYNNIKKATLNIAEISSTYTVPASVSGRFPGNGKNVPDLLQAIAYIGLTNSGIDTEVSTIFKRLYDTANAAVKGMISGSGIGIQYTLGPGGAVALIDYDQKIAGQTKTPSQFTKMLPFSGMLAAAKNDWAVSIKGFSRYIIDFECIRNDGRYLRYSSYGHMQIMSTSRNLNSYNYDKSFDWLHFPGTTSIDLGLSNIDTRGAGNNSEERNLGDERFLGGTSMSDTTAMFSMHLHDNTFDKSFRARKSVFYFGNLIYCMGSGITNNNTTYETHTTLFQNLSGASLKVDNTTLALNASYNQPTSAVSTIKNSWGNSYIVFPGTNTLFVKNAPQTGFDPAGTAMPTNNHEIAWINHGKKPSNAKYNYAMLLNEDATMASALTNTTSPAIQVLRQETDAHVIYNTLEKTYGYSVFMPNTTLTGGKLIATTRPVIAMIKENAGDTLEISLSDPDINRQADSLPANVTISIRLNGIYRFISNPSGATITISSNQTTITQTATNGATYKFIIGPKLNQSITFPGNYISKVISDVDFTPASTNSGLTIAYISSNTSVATIVNNQIKIVGQGFTTITASQSGNSDFNSATSISKSLYVDQISIGKSVTVNNVYQNSSNFNGAKAVDGNLSTRWATDNDFTNASLEVDLGGNFTFGRVMLSESFNRVTAFVVSYWNGSIWQNVFNGGAIGNTPNNISFTPVQGIKVKVSFTGTAITIPEFAVFGTPNHVLSIDTSKPAGQNVNGNNLTASVALYPNPVNKKFYVSYTLPRPSYVTIDMLNINGKKVKSIVSNALKPIGKYNDPVEVNDLNNAVYFVRFKIGDTTRIIKIVNGNN